MAASSYGLIDMSLVTLASGVREAKVPRFIRQAGIFHTSFPRKW